MTPALLAAALLFSGALDDNPDFLQGVASYRSMDVMVALTAFEKASADESLEDDEKARVFAWIGLCHGTLGDEDKMASAFMAAVGLEWDVTLPGFAPPTVRARLDEIRQTIEKPPEPEPEPDPEPEPVVERDPPVLVIGGAVSAATGVAMGIVAAVFTGVAYGTFANAESLAGEPGQFQNIVSRELQTANDQALTAGFLGGTAAVFIATGVAVGVAGWMSGELE